MNYVNTVQHNNEVYPLLVKFEFLSYKIINYTSAIIIRKYDNYASQCRIYNICSSYFLKCAEITEVL